MGIGDWGLGIGNLKKNEFIKHLERYFYFLNIFFRIDNSFANVIIKDDFNFVSKYIKIRINNIFQQFKYEEIINEHKIFILGYLNCQRLIFKKNVNWGGSILFEKIVKDINTEIKHIIK